MLKVSFPLFRFQFATLCISSTHLHYHKRKYSFCGFPFFPNLKDTDSEIFSQICFEGVLFYYSINKAFLITEEGSEKIS